MWAFAWLEEHYYLCYFPLIREIVESWNCIIVCNEIFMFLGIRYSYVFDNQTFIKIYIHMYYCVRHRFHSWYLFWLIEIYISIVSVSVYFVRVFHFQMVYSFHSHVRNLTMKNIRNSTIYNIYLNCGYCIVYVVLYFLFDKFDKSAKCMNFIKNLMYYTNSLVRNIMKCHRLVQK